MEETGPDAEREPGTTSREQAEMNRRKFLKIAAVGGAGAAVAAVAAGYLTGLIRIGGRTPPPWEVAPGVVDYTKVPGEAALRGSRVTLRIAQWFDYWPGTFLDNSEWSFATYMRNTYDIDVEYEIDYFLSNEELFLWVSPLNQKQYDVFFPSNYYCEIFNTTRWIYNLNKEWLPNRVHVYPRFLEAPYNVRGDDYLSLPYFWGTTGIGYRTDHLDPAGIEPLGWDVFQETSYGGEPLAGRMSMLDDQRDVLTTGFKGAGWEWQAGQGLTPSGSLPPNGVQWTCNEVLPDRIGAARDYLLRARPNIFDFNSTNVIPNLQTAATWVNMAWSGDVILAATPDSANPPPVDYLIPKQGASWWVDAMSIHSRATNLWVAHQFLNYIHEPEVMKRLTEWNRYSCTNKTAFDMLVPLGVSEWDMRTDPRLYPDEETFKRLDLIEDVGLSVLEELYNPLWNELKFGAQG